jgi:large subunit ribosomal protein L24
MFQAPKHEKSKRIGATLSEDLKSKYTRSSLRIRKNDNVKVMRGEYKGIEGKVTKIFTDSGRINIDGVTREKISGGNIPIKIHASNVMITSLNLDDNWRKKRLEK